MYHVVNSFKELSTSEERSRSKRSHTAQSKKVIKAVQEKVRKNSKRSARQIPKDMNESAVSMRTVFNNNIQLSL